MQDPGGDGKIVYLFLPLYQVRLTISAHCFLSDAVTAEAHRPKDGYRGPGTFKYQIHGTH